MNPVTRLGSSTPCHFTIVMSLLQSFLTMSWKVSHQYVKETNETTTNYGFTHDYSSIMHYGAASASHNKEPTTVANDTRYQESMGSQNISFIDKSSLTIIIIVKPPGCGDKLKATERKQIIVKRLGFGAGVKDEYKFCNYWIEAHEGKKVEVMVKSISHGCAHDGCILGGVEIKTTEDQSQTGYRFCSPTYRDAALVSASNRWPIIAGQQQFILEYKIKS